MDVDGNHGAVVAIGDGYLGLLGDHHFSDVMTLRNRIAFLL